MKGFTILEILMALAIAGIALAIVTLSFSKLNQNQALDKSALVIISVLDEARALTLAGKDGAQYGVNIEASQVTLFKGSSYSSVDSSNISTPLNSLIAIRNINLAGGGNSVIFQKLTGKTAQTGSLEVYLKDDSTRFHTISINSNGVVEEN